MRIEEDLLHTERGVEVSPQRPGAVMVKQDTMRTATGHQVDGAIKATEGVPKRRISFDEALRFLEESPLMIGGLECKGLEEAREKAVKADVRWGLVTTLAQKHNIKGASGYAELFNKATVDFDDLQKAKEAIERGEKMQVIFDAGVMKPDELFETLFQNGRIPLYYKNSDVLKNLGTMRRIDPRVFQNLQGLNELSSKEQSAAFSAAYREAQPLQATGPRIIFTPDERKVTGPNTSATQDVQAASEGGKFLDFTALMLLLRTQMEANSRISTNDLDRMTPGGFKDSLVKVLKKADLAEYMQKGRTILRDPFSVFENGKIPYLLFGSHDHMVNVGHCNPSDAYDSMESRISLG